MTETGRVKCPECKNQVRERNVRQTKLGYMCSSCWRIKHRKELKASFEPLPRLKPDPRLGSHRILDSVIHPEKFPMLKKKRCYPLRKPIRDSEKSVL